MQSVQSVQNAIEDFAFLLHFSFFAKFAFFCFFLCFYVSYIVLFFYVFFLGGKDVKDRPKDALRWMIFNMKKNPGKEFFEVLSSRK